MGLFDWVGLRTDVGKTVSMIIQPLYTVRKHSDTDYEQLIMGGVMTYLAHQKQRAWCLEFAAYLEAGYLAAHCHTQNGDVMGTQ